VTARQAECFNLWATIFFHQKSEPEQPQKNQQNELQANFNGVGDKLIQVVDG